VSINIEPLRLQWLYIFIKENNQNRLLQHYHKVDDKPEILLADNAYNELSQLSSKSVGWSAGVPLQRIDYAYNIRGWMTRKKA